MRRTRITDFVFAALAGALLVAASAAPAAAACHTIADGICPTGVTEFCDGNSSSVSSARDACLACTGSLACTSQTYDIYNGCTWSYDAYDPAPSLHFITGGTNCPAGQIFGVPASWWAEPATCSNGVQDSGLENGVDCDLSCASPCCVVNGSISSTEQCDDNNNTGGDGCTNCRIDNFCWTCSGTPSYCAPRSAGTACPSDSNECTLDQCNGEGSCEHYSLSGNSCNSDGNPCTIDQCFGSTCAHQPQTGTACPSDGNFCTADTCNNGTCVHSPAHEGESCTDDGNACTGDVCQSGSCAHHNLPPGYPCDNDGNSCTSDVCDGGGSCNHNVTVGSSCDDDFNPCTIDYCNVSGTCSHDVLAGAACDSDGNECTSDVCDAGGSCTHEINVGAACSDDSNECTRDACDAAGTCVHLARAGESCSADANPCTFDSCSVAGSCDHDANVGAACDDDGDPCTADSCDASGNCAHTPLGDGASCSDGNACTSGDTCQAGSCSGTAVTCTAQDACHEAGTCDPATGQCSNPPAVDWTACDDGNKCTQTDLCYSGSCVGSNDVLCYSLNQCFAPGTCDPATGVCSDPTPRPNGASCTDGNACTQNDTCQFGGSCIPGAAASCNQPPGPCYDAGYCDYASGDCVYTPKGDYAPCDDGSSCTSGDICLGGTCSGSALPDGSWCSDSNLCTTDDSCQDGSCEPGEPFMCKKSSDACHVANTCDPYLGCSESPIDCDDGNVCTTDSCDKDTGCQHAPVVCEASDACHSAGTCNPLSGCAETPITCDDGSPCTTDTCDPSGGCQFEAAIRNDCRAASGSKLSYADSDDDAKDKLTWKWGPGTSTSASDFGMPASSTDYQLCIFAVRSGGSSVLLDATVPASASYWGTAGRSGFKYTDKSGTADGVTKVLLKGSDADKTKIGVSGRGTQLSDPALPLGASVEGVQVQLGNLANGVCWESAFPAASISESDGKFGGKVQ